jgi:hypothetical protein
MVRIGANLGPGPDSRPIEPEKPKGEKTEFTMPLSKLEISDHDKAAINEAADFINGAAGSGVSRKDFEAKKTQILNDIEDPVLRKKVEDLLNKAGEGGDSWLGGGTFQLLATELRKLIE